MPHHPVGMTQGPLGPGFMGVMPEPSLPPRRVVSEPRLVLLALLAAAVAVIGIIAIIETDDIWILVVTIVAIVLVVALLAIDVLRVIDRSSDGD
jgi:hypothetical protein